MAESAIVELIRRLHSRTLESRLKWEETAQEGVFQVAFPEYVAQISEYDEASRAEYIMRIYDSAGSLIEEVGDSDLREWPLAYSVMRELYIEARRSAKGVDKAIRSILSTLD